MVSLDSGIESLVLYTNIYGGYISSSMLTTESRGERPNVPGGYVLDHINHQPKMVEERKTIHLPSVSKDSSAGASGRTQSTSE